MLCLGQDTHFVEKEKKQYFLMEDKIVISADICLQH